MNNLLEELSKPFSPDDISFKPGASKGDKCLALAYADLRVYQTRLDEVCGLDWSCRYVPWEGKSIICELTIGGVTRSSTGESDAQDEKNNMAGSVSEAMAFKRACAAFGLGRFLYSLPSLWIGFDGAAKKISKEGQAELDNRYRTWYTKTMAAAKKSAPVERKVDADTGEIVESDKVDGDALFSKDGPPYYVTDWHKLTGKEYDLVDWVRQLHANQSGPCTKAQYGYIVAILDELTSNQHGYILSLLCQAEITKTNVPSKDAASALIKFLAKTIKVRDEGSIEVDAPNPKYRQDMALMLFEMTQPMPA